MEEITKEQLNHVSMNVILHAGNAKELAYDAVREEKQGHLDKVKEKISGAKKEITTAHQFQTELLQKEAEGIDIPYSPLFGHAQDTLMTSQSEVNLIDQMLQLFEFINEESDNG